MVKAYFFINIDVFLVVKRFFFSFVGNYDRFKVDYCWDDIYQGSMCYMVVERFFNIEKVDCFVIGDGIYEFVIVFIFQLKFVDINVLVIFYELGIFVCFICCVVIFCYFFFIGFYLFYVVVDQVCFFIYIFYIDWGESSDFFFIQIE